MGKTYVVEAIQPRRHHRTDFGDSLRGEHCEGAIVEEQSRIRPENGFVNIGYDRNPMDYIEALERRGRDAE